MIPVNKRQEDNSVIDWKETEKITVEKQNSDDTLAPNSTRFAKFWRHFATSVRVRAAQDDGDSTRDFMHPQSVISHYNS